MTISGGAKKDQSGTDPVAQPVVDAESDAAPYPIGVAIERALRRYFCDLDGVAPCDLYQMVMNEVEKPLLRTVMAQARGNSTRAAQMLGINRNTLRKKLRHHELNGATQQN